MLPGVSKVLTRTRFWKPDRPGIHVLMRQGSTGTVARVNAKEQLVSALIGILSSPLQSIVVDNTGMTGKYDFQLEYLLQLGPDDSGTNLQTALREQLGLQLESTRVPSESLVIDRAGRVPSAY